MDDAKRLFNRLWQGGQYAYYWLNPPKTSQWFEVSDIGQIPNGRRNIYFGIHPVSDIPPTNARDEPKPPHLVRSQNKYISTVNCLFGEFDFKDYGSLDNIASHLKDYPKASIVIFSGGGYHLYWLLDDTFFITSGDAQTRIQEAQYNWVDWTGSDKQSKDLARVLRVPGTRNYKDCYAPNYPLVKILRADLNLTYDLEYLEELSQPPPEPEPEPIPDYPIYHNGDERKWYETQALKTASEMIREAVDGEKHSTLLKAARLLGGYVGGGIITNEQAAINLLENAIKHKPNVKDLNAAYSTIRDGVEYGKSEPITLEDKLRERELWKWQMERTQKPQGDTRFWSRQYEGYWELAR